MKDRILTTYVNDFIDAFSLGKLEEATAFEYLASHCVVSKYNLDSFEPSDVAVGGPGDLGIDGIGILVNDHLVQTNSAVDHLKNELHRLDVQIHLCASEDFSEIRGS